MKRLAYTILTLAAIFLAGCLDVPVDSGSSHVVRDPKKRDTTRMEDSLGYRGGEAHPRGLNPFSFLMVYYQTGSGFNFHRDSVELDIAGSLSPFTVDKQGDGRPVTLKDLHFRATIPSDDLPGQCSLDGLRSIEVQVPVAAISTSPSAKVDLTWSPSVPDSSGAAILLEQYGLPFSTGYVFERRGRTYRCQGSFQVTRIDADRHIIDAWIDTKFYYVVGGSDDVRTIDLDMRLRLRYS